jgi:phosphate transport system substrate-binding protein
MNLRFLCSRFLPCLVFSLLMQSLQAETITLAGVGSLSPLVSKLGEAFEKANPGHSVVVLQPPLGSAGGIRALNDRRIDVALAGRPLKTGEAGRAIPWLMTPLVVATQGGQLKTGLDTKTLADIFAGRRTAWDNGKPIRFVMRGLQDTESQLLRGLSREVADSLETLFKRSDFPVAENDLEAVETLERISGSFGTTTLGLLKVQNSRLQTLALNGEQPSLLAVQKGKYSLTRKYFLVTGAEPQPVVAAFLAYVQSPAAMKLAARYEYAPFLEQEAGSK